MSNPLLTEPLTPEHIKPRLLGHWGTSPGLNLVYTHLNRVIKARGLDALCVWGPGHGGPAVLANSWLEGSYSETYPDVSRDAAGMDAALPAVLLPRRRAQPCRPGDARLDPRGRRARLLARPRVRRRLRQPGSAGRLRDRRRRGGDRTAGRVLALQQVPRPGARRRGPADPAPQRLQDRQPDGARPAPRGRTRRAAARLRPRTDPRHRRRPARGPPRHGRRRSTRHWTASRRTQRTAREDGATERVALADDRAAYAEGLDGPRRGRRTARSRAPGAPTRSRCPASAKTRSTCGSWRPGCARTVPRSSSTPTGGPRADVLACVPEGAKRLGATPHANGGLLAARPADAAARPTSPCPSTSRAPPCTSRPGSSADLLRTGHAGHRRAPRLPSRRPGRDRVQPARRRLRRQRQGLAGTRPCPVDEHLDRHGRVHGDPLRTHSARAGWRAICSPAGTDCSPATRPSSTSSTRWSTSTSSGCAPSRELPWRPPIASLNYLLTSHVWRQDHNGFSHQDPGFIDHVLNKSPEVVRVYLPPDANTLLSVADHVLRSRDYVNVIVAGKQPCFDWLSMDEARAHCARGAGIWDWAGTRGRRRTRRGAGLRGRRTHPGDPGRGRSCCAATCRNSPSASSTSSTWPGCCPARNIRTGWATSSTTACSPPTSR